jgi:hypothetical protein
MFEYLLAQTTAQAAALATWNERQSTAGFTVSFGTPGANPLPEGEWPTKRAASDEAGMVSRAASHAREGGHWQNDPRHTQLP